MGKEKGFAMTPLKSREVQRWLERRGYATESGQHKHLKLVHPERTTILLPLQPSSQLSMSAAKQIAHALGYRNVQALLQGFKHD